MSLLQQLEESAGVYFGPNAQLRADGARLRMTANGLACDAQPSLVTTSSAGIPAFLSTIVDPKVIEILLAPMKAVEVIGQEVRKGDWTTDTATFIAVESTGEVASYDDNGTGGVSGVNINFPTRQSFHYQVVTQWGERQLEQAGLAKLDLASRLNIASILNLNKFQNSSYFYGIDGLQNYGLLNDPALSASIVPTTKVAGGTTWDVATAQEVLNDIAKLFKRLQSQAGGVVALDSQMTLAMSPTAQAAGMTKVSDFNVSVPDQLKKLYPNLRMVTAVEYVSDAGQMVQLIGKASDGQPTADAAFTEKLRTHPIVIDLSAFKQKKSQGTWGAVIYQPFLIASMLGV